MGDMGDIREIWTASDLFKVTYLSRIDVKQCCSLGCAHCRGNRLDHLRWSVRKRRREKAHLTIHTFGEIGNALNDLCHPVALKLVASLQSKLKKSFFTKCSYKQYVIIPPHDDNYIKRIPIQLKKSISWYYCLHWPTGRIVLSTTVGLDVLSIYVRPA